MALSADSFQTPVKSVRLVRNPWCLKVSMDIGQNFSGTPNPQTFVIVNRSKETTSLCNSHNFPTVSNSQEIASTLACASFVGLVEAQN